jgi:hypothetical protein
MDIGISPRRDRKIAAEGETGLRVLWNNEVNLSSASPYFPDSK